MTRRLRCSSIVDSLIRYGFVVTVIFWTLYIVRDHAGARKRTSDDVSALRPDSGIQATGVSMLSAEEMLGKDQKFDTGGTAPVRLARLQQATVLAPHQQAPAESRNIDGYDMTKFTQEMTNIYFVKVHKAGSTTVQNILYRYGLNRNLLFALFACPNGMPFPQVASKEYLVRDSHHSEFNIMCDHALFDETTHRQYMPDNTVVIGILRHPLEQLRSSIAFHGLTKPMHLTTSDPTTEFLSDPSSYDARIRFTGSSRHCGPVLTPSFTQNHMAYHFGYRRQQNNSQVYIDRFMADMNRTLDFMLILERLDESLVLLKRLLRWRTEDIISLPLFSTASFGKKPMKNSRDATATRELIAKHRKWSTADYVMYEHYSAKLNRTLQQQSDDFYSELQLFRLLKERVRSHCKNMCNIDVINHMRSLRQTSAIRTYLESHRMDVAASDWSEAFSVSYTNCLAMMLGTLEYQAALKNKQAVKNCDTGTPVQPGAGNSKRCDDNPADFVFYTFSALSIQRMVFKDVQTCSKHFA